MSKMHPAETIMRTPWPEASVAQSQGQRDSNQPQQPGNQQETNKGLWREKRAALPKLIVELIAAENQPADDGRISFTAHLKYESIPVGDDISIVGKILKNSTGPLGNRSFENGQYQIFTTPDCAPESLVPYSTTYVTYRRARGPDGKYLPLPDQTEDVTEENGWAELQVGSGISRDFTVELDDNKAWRDNLQAGKTYWLAYAPPGKAISQRAELPHWRFGSMQDWEDKKFDYRDDTWIPIPIRQSNAISFLFC